MHWIFIIAMNLKLFFVQPTNFHNLNHERVFKVGTSVLVISCHLYTASWALAYFLTKIGERCCCIFCTGVGIYHRVICLYNSWLYHFIQPGELWLLTYFPYPNAPAGCLGFMWKSENQNFYSETCRQHQYLAKFPVKVLYLFREGREDIL